MAPPSTMRQLESICLKTIQFSRPNYSKLLAGNRNGRPHASASSVWSLPMAIASALLTSALSSLKANDALPTRNAEVAENAEKRS